MSIPVPSSDQVAELMLHWEEARQHGRQISAEEVCAESPELAQEVTRRIQAILSMEQVFGFAVAGLSRSEPANHDAPHESLPIIPGYEILRVVDRGGMGVVYEARQIAVGRTVAIKMISSPHLRPKVLARFRVEAEAAARLQHPNFVQVFEVGQVSNRPYISMEFVDGGSLARMIENRPPTFRRAAEILETLARAVSAAHGQGIVHRDLKPSNVMLTNDGIPKIADFGLAKRLDDNSGHTHTGEILGTPSYMAPEQAEGRKDQIGPATDIYALGTILYESLTGLPPFRGVSPLDSLRLVVSEDPVAPAHLVKTVPRDLEAICLKCLEKSPSQRYSSALALADDLRRFLDGRPVLARRLGLVRRVAKGVRRHPQTVALVLTVGMLAVIAGFLLMGPYLGERRIRARAQAVAPAVREILKRNCFECHGSDPQKVQRNLHILRHQDLLDSARRIVVSGSPDDSRLIQRIKDGSMPPEEDEVRLPRLSQNELDILSDWILGGAPPFPSEDDGRPGLDAVPRSELAAQTKAIFHKRCFECHKSDVAKNGIKILHHRLLVSVRKVVVPGDPEHSELFTLLTNPDDEKRMPPAPARRLSPDEIATVRAWILEGAPPFPKNE